MTLRIQEQNERRVMDVLSRLPEGELSDRDLYYSTYARLGMLEMLHDGFIVGPRQNGDAWIFASDLWLSDFDTEVAERLAHNPAEAAWWDEDGRWVGEGAVPNVWDNAVGVVWKKRTPKPAPKPAPTTGEQLTLAIAHAESLLDDAAG